MFFVRLITICDILSENPAKVIFLWSVFKKKKKKKNTHMVKNILWKCNLYWLFQYWLSKVMSKIKIIVKLIVEIKLWCLFSHN